MWVLMLKAARYRRFGAVFAFSFLFSVPALAEPSVEEVLSAVVRVKSEIAPGARTAKTLGLERQGNGIVIDSSGLVVTIGYLILEATAVTVTGPKGVSQPARVVAYDHNTGFGLLRTAKPLPVTPMRLGDSTALTPDSAAIVVGYGGEDNAIRVQVVARRDFAGYWEYLLPNAIFTQPPFNEFSGAALIDTTGRLVGVGSLVVGDANIRRVVSPGNMFVPVEALKPILGQLIARGRSDEPRRPWVGVYTEEHRNRVFVTRLAEGGPGDQAGVAVGDIIVSIAGKPVRNQIDFYRKLWAMGNPGVAVPLTVLRQEGGLDEITVTSGDRYDWLVLDTNH